MAKSPMSEEERAVCCLLGGCGCGQSITRRTRALGDLLKMWGPEAAAAMLLKHFILLPRSTFATAE